LTRRTGTGKRPAGTPAITALAAAGVAYSVHTYDPVPGAASYGLRAASALGVDPARLFKTLVASVDGRLVVAVVPVAGNVDLKAVAGAVGGKRAELADAALAERTTGYVLGGISPLGQRKTLPTVVDATAMDHPSVFVSGGRRGLEVELDPAELIRLTGAASAAVGQRAQQ
jgi:Cys-tRNA(Pro)/Cys-tRNA(Cys) deacylase